MKTFEEKLRKAARERCSTKEEYLTDFGVACFEDGAYWARGEVQRQFLDTAELKSSDITARARRLAEFVTEDCDPVDVMLFSKLIVEAYCVGAQDERELLTGDP